MKLFESLENVPTVANSVDLLGNPSWVGALILFNGRRWDRGLLLDSTAL